jgi:cytochrome c-type biogenesis protein CcmH
VTGRRHFTLHAGAAVAAAALRAVPLRAQSPAGADTALDADPLRQPWATGRQRDTLTPFDSDPIIVALERRMRCTCGCTLDIYTCRTTDFTCTFSPALHKEVVEMYQGGQTPEQIIAFFVAREGEAILMAPPAEGFNLAGYLVPGLVMASGALALAAWLSRRRALVATVEGADGGGAAGAVASHATAEPDPSQQDALRRALDEVES